MGRRMVSLVGKRRDALVRAMWEEAAAGVGAEIEEIAARMFQVRRDGATTHIFGIKTPFADPVSDTLASEKALAYELLSTAEIPIPDRIIVVDPRDARAREYLATSPGACVVKPVHAGGAGRGVTASVLTSSQLARAIRLARVFSPTVMVEREAAGDHYRFLLLDGQILDVLKRLHPTVCGDGSSTIGQLMLQEYERRTTSETTAGLKPFAVDLDCLFTLERQGIDLAAVPDAGQIVTVKATSNISGPRECTTFRGPLSPAVIDDVRAAARVLGVRLAGVDVVSRDVSQPLRVSGGVVLEVNPVPGLFHHYNVAVPHGASRVAETILEKLLAHPGS